jgi:hypothetical protein
MSAPATIDAWEAELLLGTVLALRRRADRQAKRAQDGTAHADDGSPIMTGEAAIAARVSLTLSQLAAEFELELSPLAAPAPDPEPEPEPVPPTPPSPYPTPAAAVAA